MHGGAANVLIIYKLITNMFIIYMEIYNYLLLTMKFSKKKYVILYTRFIYDKFLNYISNIKLNR